MGKRKYHLLKIYKNFCFEDINNKLCNQFLVYNIILIGFTIMFISFLKKFNYFNISLENFIIVLFVLIPLMYLIIKSIYGLILIQEGYQFYHYQLILEYSILFMIGYHVLVLEIINDINQSMIFLIESIILYFSILFLKSLNKYFIVFITIAFMYIIYCYLSIFHEINIYYYLTTYVMMLIFSLNLFQDISYIKQEIKFIQQGKKNYPNGIVTEYIDL